MPTAAAISTAGTSHSHDVDTQQVEHICFGLGDGGLVRSAWVMLDSRLEVSCRGRFQSPELRGRRSKFQRPQSLDGDWSHPLHASKGFRMASLESKAGAKLGVAQIGESQLLVTQGLAETGPHVVLATAPMAAMLPKCNVAVCASATTAATSVATSVPAARRKTICLSAGCDRELSRERKSDTPANTGIPTSYAHASIACFTTFEELTPYADDWDRLAAGVPFRSWTWLSHWWRHYGPRTTPSAANAVWRCCASSTTPAAGRRRPWYLDCSACTAACCGRWARAKSVPTTSACFASRRWKKRSSKSWPITSSKARDRRARRLAMGLAGTRRRRCRGPHRGRPGRLLGRLGLHGPSPAGYNCWRLELPTDLGTATSPRWARTSAATCGVWSGNCSTRAGPCCTRSRGSTNCRWRWTFSSSCTSGGGRCWAKGLFRLGAVSRLLSRRRARVAPPRPGPVPLAGTGRQAGGGRISTGGRRRAVCLSGGHRSRGDGASAGQVDQPGDPAAGDRAAAIGRSISSAATSRTRPASAPKPRPSIEFRVVPPRPVARLRHNLWLAGNNVKAWVKRGVRGETGIEKQELRRSA